MRTTIFIVTLVLATPAFAVSLSQVIRDCGDDGKKFCKGVGYGQPMQDCLIAHKAELQPSCKPIISKLEHGDKVRLLEW